MFKVKVDVFSHSFDADIPNESNVQVSIWMNIYFQFVDNFS